eukprot:701223-Rhodomonas_salina.1
MPGRGMGEGKRQQLPAVPPARRTGPRERRRPRQHLRLCQRPRLLWGALRGAHTLPGGQLL